MVKKSNFIPNKICTLSKLLPINSKHFFQNSIKKYWHLRVTAKQYWLFYHFQSDYQIIVKRLVTGYSKQYQHFQCITTTQFWRLLQWFISSNTCTDRELLSTKIDLFRVHIKQYEHCQRVIPYFFYYLFKTILTLSRSHCQRFS